MQRLTLVLACATINAISVLCIAAPPATMPAHEPGVGASGDTAASASTLPSSVPGATSLTASDKMAVTSHRITIGGQVLPYTATAGYMPLKDETGKLRANIFFIAYVKSPAIPENPGGPATQPARGESAAGVTGNSGGRPITFVFNGGPGAASAWLHLGAAGPYCIALTDNGEAPAPPYHLTENHSTWLTETDLVFIDPVGTGYSRAATPEQAKDFYNMREDLSALAEFIRLYVTRYERWDSPKFIAGESYGGTRAAALADLLPQYTGLALNGVVLISPALSFANIFPSEANELPYALYLPSYTAAAFYHRKLPPDLLQDLDKTLAESQSFALTTYLPALAQGTNLPEADRHALIDKLARYTGLPADLIDKAHLRIDPERFEKSLLADDRTGGRIIGRFDARITAYAADPLASGPEFDPSLATVLPVYAATFNSYVRQALHYENDLPYEVLKSVPFDFHAAGNGPVYVGDNLRAAMQKNPHLKVLVASGRFDLAEPFTATSYTLSHLDLPAPLRPNITQTWYPGGHMFYHEQGALKQFHADLATFIHGAAGQP